MLSSSADKSCVGKDEFWNWPANWPDGNWPDGNWEELPIEFCEDGVDGFEDDDCFGLLVLRSCEKLRLGNPSFGIRDIFLL
ncbi:hypothetical protein Tco_1450828 [Tanacetum coccineum]